MFSPRGSVLKALIHALSLFFRLLVFYILYWLDSDIGEVVVFLLKVSVQVSLDPIGWSFVNLFARSSIGAILLTMMFFSLSWSLIEKLEVSALLEPQLCRLNSYNV